MAYPAATAPRAPATAARLNFVVLLADDVRHGSLSAAGHPLLSTPHLDRLATRGVRFANAFVTTSLCSPSRASFLTGLPARSHGVIDNDAPLPADLDTYASLLLAAGYDTAYFGKWHMGDQTERPGFARAVTYDGQGDYLDAELRSDGRPVPAPGHVDDRVTDHLIEFLREERERPFLACVGFKGAHGPLTPAERFAGLYAELDDATLAPSPVNAAALPPFPLLVELEELAGGGRPSRAEVPVGWKRASAPPSLRAGGGAERARRYLRTVTQIDENVGRVLAALDELGLSASTAVVYASDNGYFDGQHGLGLGKRAAYEESIRIDFLMRVPGAAYEATGPELDALVLNLDLAPTLLELAGLEPPAAMEGRSLVPLLAGADAPWRCDFVYEYTRERRFPIPSLEMLYSACDQDHTWKLTRYPGQPGWTELFDLGADPFELNNLWGTDGVEAVSAALEARLDELLAVPADGR